MDAGQVTLNSLARERGFSVQKVQRDGHYLFSAVEVQLESLNTKHGEIGLRERLVEYLQSHPYTHDGSSHLREFILAPVVSEDPSNADTEAPSEQDEFISSIEDPQMYQQLRWLRYLERLNTGAWGDNIAVQRLANMLHSTLNPDMEVIRTSHNTPADVVHFGLIDKFHYQALKTIHPSSNKPLANQSDPLTDKHDKEFVEDQEAFKHQAQLRGLPYDSFLMKMRKQCHLKRRANG